MIERTLNKSDPKNYKCASGFYVDLIIDLSNKLQFSYEVYEVEDKAWGGQSKSITITTNSVHL